MQIIMIKWGGTIWKRWAEDGIKWSSHAIKKEARLSFTFQLAANQALLSLIKDLGYGNINDNTMCASDTVMVSEQSRLRNAPWLLST